MNVKKNEDIVDTVILGNKESNNDECCDLFILQLKFLKEITTTIPLQLQAVFLLEQSNETRYPVARGKLLSNYRLELSTAQES
jgi:hypothetical protein